MEARDVDDSYFQSNGTNSITRTRRRRHSQFVHDRRSAKTMEGASAIAGDVSQSRCPNTRACNDGETDSATGLNKCYTGYDREEYGCAFCAVGWGRSINDPFQCYQCSILWESFAMALRVGLMVALWQVARYTCHSKFSSRHGSMCTVFRIFLSSCITFMPLTTIQWTNKEWVNLVTLPISGGFVAQFHIDCVFGAKFAEPMHHRLLLVVAVPSSIFVLYLSLAAYHAHTGRPMSHIPKKIHFLPLGDAHDPDNPERHKQHDRGLVLKWNAQWAVGLVFYLVGPEVLAQAVASTSCYTQMIGERKDGRWAKVQTYSQEHTCGDGFHAAMPVFFFMITLGMLWAVRLVRSRRALKFYLDVKCVAHGADGRAEMADVGDEDEDDLMGEEEDSQRCGSLTSRFCGEILMTQMQLTKDSDKGRGDPTDMVRAHHHLVAFYTQAVSSS